MRAPIATCLLVGMTFGAMPAMAQEAETLRKELEQLGQRFESVRREYQKAIETISERLKRLEARPQPVARQPTPTPGAPSAPHVQAAPAEAPSKPTLIDYARPRPPFSLAARTGRGQLLFDMGIAGDFVANLTQENVDQANAGTFAGRENRFFPREIELSLFGQIDPYARGEVRIEAAEEFEDGARVTEVGLAEANLTLLTLPFGTQLKMGQMRNRFGLLNERHQHDLPQIDRPNVLVRFFGEEQLVERGLELTWVPNLPLYLEALAGIFNGDNEEAFGSSSLRRPLATGRLRTFFELGDLGAIQLGGSVARGHTEARRRQTFAGYDVKYKFTPDGWGHALLTLASEGLGSIRKVEIEGEEDRTRERFGWYASAEVQPWKRWIGGIRYDSTQLLEDPGREWAIQPYIAFMPSEFLRFRLAYKRTERDRREPFADNDATARIVDEWLFQATFILGAHPAHPF